MKVDLGQCAVCGAKNSKYVEKCYKCGAPLPWASGYVAPKNAPQKPLNSPSSAPTGAGAKTVVIPPIDEAKSTPIVEPQTTSGAPTIAERAQNKVQVPAWAIVAGGLGLLLLGMALWALLGKKPAPPLAVAATPGVTTAALAPIVPAAQPTVGPTADATAIPTSAPTVAPVAVAATVAPTTAATATGAASSISGPTFDELQTNLATGTPQQQSLYWDSIKGKKISWRGEFVSLGNAATGPLVVNCKNAKGTLKVIVNLDSTTPQTLPKYAPNQSVPFEGMLESHSAGAVMIKDGRAG